LADHVLGQKISIHLKEKGKRKEKREASSTINKEY
jgi:hypothetical protein